MKAEHDCELKVESAFSRSSNDVGPYVAFSESFKVVINYSCDTNTFNFPTDSLTQIVGQAATDYTIVVTDAVSDQAITDGYSSASPYCGVIQLTVTLTGSGIDESFDAATNVLSYRGTDPSHIGPHVF